MTKLNMPETKLYEAPTKPTKLYIVEVKSKVDDWWGRDCQYAVVVRAHSHAEARKMAVITSGDEDKRVWLEPKLTTCHELLNEGKVGLIIRDFLNG